MRSSALSRFDFCPFHSFPPLHPLWNLIGIQVLAIDSPLPADWIASSLSGQAGIASMKSSMLWCSRTEGCHPESFGRIKFLPGKPPSRFFYGYIVVAAAAVIMTVAWGTNRSFGVFLEAVLREFGWTRAAVSASFTINVVITGILAIYIGRLTDRFGPRAVVAGCGLFLGMAYLLTSRVQSLTEFYLFYGILGGVGMSGMLVPMMTLVIRWFVKRRALMSGILVAGPGFGIIVFPLIASYLIAVAGWRAAYFILGIIVLAIILGTAYFLRREPGELGLLPYGAGDGTGERSTSGIFGLNFGEAFRTRQFWMMNLVSFCDHLLVNTMVVHIVIHARDLGIPATQGATVLSLAAGVSIPGRILIGGFADRVGIRVTFLICLGNAVVAFLILLFAGGLTSLYFFSVFLGISLWSTGGLLSPFMAEVFGSKAHATLYAFSIFAGSLGSAVGPVTAGYFFDITGSYRIAFLFCLAVSCASFIAVFLIRPLGKQAGDR
jgi:OFA family oxalate/formate antiporter-like MFS transporter